MFILPINKHNLKQNTRYIINYKYDTYTDIEFLQYTYYDGEPWILFKNSSVCIEYPNFIRSISVTDIDEIFIVIHKKFPNEINMYINKY